MSILETEKIDFVTVAKDHIGLIQLDAIEWGGEFDDTEHVYLIQENINTCLAYFEAGQHRREYPEYANFPVKIVLVPVHPLGEMGERLIKRSRPFVEKAGLELIVDPDYGLVKQ